MNRIHRLFCRSDFWAKQLSQRLMPWALNGTSLGTDLLEIGPGPGLATDVLMQRAERVTSIEIDEALAGSLAERMRGSNVEVVHGDATELPFESGRFSAAVCFTMLHHVPSHALQDRLLCEVHRVLAPGAVFAGSDSLSSRFFELLHTFDTLVPVDPAGFGARLEAAGFGGVEVVTARKQFRFRASKPR